MNDYNVVIGLVRIIIGYISYNFLSTSLFLTLGLLLIPAIAFIEYFGQMNLFHQISLFIGPSDFSASYDESDIFRFIGYLSIGFWILGETSAFILRKKGIHLKRNSFKSKSIMFSSIIVGLYLLNILMILFIPIRGISETSTFVLVLTFFASVALISGLAYSYFSTIKISLLRDDNHIR